MIVSVAALSAPRWTGLPPDESLRAAIGILGPALIVFLLGLYDDVRTVGPYWKFAVQIIAGVLLYTGGFGIHRVDLLSSGKILQTAISLPLTVLWVLLITNAFNLIDGLDGLAAGSALFSTLVVFVVSLLNSNPIMTCLTIVLAGAILGFLRFNFHPASIFLGDSGSLFIGFMLSALALAGSQKAPTMIAVAIPVVSFGLPILDVALAVTRRFLAGKPLFRGDDDHIHHKLLKRGLSQREAVLTLYAVTALFAVLSLVLLHGADTIALVLTVIGLGVWMGVQNLRYLEFSEIQDLVRKTKNRRQLFANNLEIRRATESLSSCEDLSTICRILRTTLQPLGFDGFQLKNPKTDGCPELIIPPLQNNGDGWLHYCWNGSETPEPAWALKLVLITSTGDRVGQFSLFRMGIEDHLLLDVGLFSSNFRMALAGAVSRAMNQIQLPAKSEDGRESKPAAKAASSSPT
jgi:UDP-GlcNAc:undecaprenyl-phosphate GlcNAc-1-phosphate transferase